MLALVMLVAKGLYVGAWNANKELISATGFGICLIFSCKIDAGLERKVGDEVVGGRLVEMLL